MPAGLVGLDILSLILGILGGFYLGKWDSRKSDLDIFEALTISVSGLVLFQKATLEGEDPSMVSDSEINETKQEWFGEELGKRRMEIRTSRRRALLTLAFTLLIFSIAHLLGELGRI